jgi:hypothetical protein
MLLHPSEAATGSRPSTQARASLRRHAMAAAAHFAAQAQVDIEDKALALIAEFMIAVTLTDDQKSVSLLPQAVMAAARLLFSPDEIMIARAELLEEGLEDESEARVRPRRWSRASSPRSKVVLALGRATRRSSRSITAPSLAWQG